MDDWDNFDEPTHYPALGYKVKPNVLDISGKMNFVSLKDQIIRGRWVIDALYDAKTFVGLRSERYDLLIVGAGAAGVSAAIRAAEKGLRTLIVDKAPKPFVRQQGSKRLVSLSMYDWPAHHWDKGPWPHTEPVEYANAKFKLTTGSLLRGISIPGSGVVVTAEQLVVEWRKKFDSVCQSNKANLTFLPQCSLQNADAICFRKVRQRNRVDVRLVYTEEHIAHPGKTILVSPHIVILALGPPSENVRIGNAKTGYYEGSPFWKTDEKRNKVFFDCLDRDPIEDPNYKPLNSILIAGGGDSGVQDFLRTVLKPRWHNLQFVIDALKTAAGAVGFEQLEREILAAVWQTERARQIGGGAQHITSALHRRVVVATRRFVDMGAPGSFAPTIKNAIQSMVRRPMPNITWIINASPVYFGGNYVLNRFLAILLIRYFRHDRAATEKYHSAKIKVHSGTTTASPVQNSRGMFVVNWDKCANASRGGGKVTVDAIVPHFGPNQKQHSPGNRWFRRPTLRYRGLRRVFERLAQPFKPIA